MLSDRLIVLSILALLIFVPTGCKKPNEPPPYKLFEDKSQVIQVARDVLGSDVAFANSGYYLSDSLKSIVAGVEVSEKNQFGIKFYLIDWVEGEFKEVYATEVMEGSFTKCLVDKIKFSDLPHELLYYNSQGYFLGSGGGEVYSHVINFQAKENYTAHLTVASRGDIYLELSNNIKIPMLKTFFVSYFKREYPTLIVINSDSTPNI